MKRGSNHTAEAREKISQGRRGKTSFGHRHSAETKELMGRKSAERWRDPEYRARHLPRLLAMQAEASKKGAAVQAAQSSLPPKGTPERRHYLKVQKYLGTEAARATL